MVRSPVWRRRGAACLLLIFSSLWMPPAVLANPAAKGSLRTAHLSRKVVANLLRGPSQRGWYCGTPDLILKNAASSPFRFKNLLHRLKQFLIPAAHAEKKPLHQAYQKAISLQLRLTKENLRQNIDHFPPDFSANHPFRRALQDTFEVIKETTTVIVGGSDIRIVEITEEEYKTDSRFKWDGKQVIPNALVSSDLPNQIFVVREKFQPSFETDPSKAAHEFFAIVAHEVAHMLFDENVPMDQRQDDPGLYALATEYRARLVDATIFVVNDKVNDMTAEGNLPGLSALLANALLDSNNDSQFSSDSLVIGFMDSLLSFLYGYGDVASYLLRQMNRHENDFAHQEAQRMHLPQDGNLEMWKKSVGKRELRNANERWKYEFARKIIRSDFMRPLKAREVPSESVSQGGGSSAGNPDGGESSSTGTPSGPAAGAPPSEGGDDPPAAGAPLTTGFPTGASEGTAGESVGGSASSTSSDTADSGADHTGETASQPANPSESSDGQPDSDVESGGMTAGNSAGSEVGEVSEAGVWVDIENNDDGSFTATGYSIDEGGNTTIIGSETYTNAGTDENGNTVWSGDQGGSMTGPQPPDGTYEVQRTEEGPGFSTGGAAECSVDSDCGTGETCNTATGSCAGGDSGGEEDPSTTTGARPVGSEYSGSGTGPHRSDAAYGSGSEGDLQYCLDTASSDSGSAGCYRSYMSAMMEEMVAAAENRSSRWWRQTRPRGGGGNSGSGGEADYPPSHPCYGMTESECIEYKESHSPITPAGD